MVKQKFCLLFLSLIYFLSKSVLDFPCSIQDHSLWELQVFSHGCSRKEWELLVLPVPSVCLDLLCQHQPFQYPSGKIKPGNESLLHVGYSMAMEQLMDKARGSFLLCSHQPQTPVLMAGLLSHLPAQTPTVCSAWLTQILWILPFRAKVLFFISEVY